MSLRATTAANYPRVSVVMAVNRSDQYLDHAIKSILQQTYRDFEFLILVDKTVPRLAETIHLSYSEDPRIRVIDVTPLGGLALALNVGIGEARGDYIARMDGDDVSLPERFDEQVKWLDSHPAVAILGSRVQLIDAHSAPLPDPHPYYETDYEIRRILPIRNPMPHPALMMRKSVLFAAGGYRYGHSSEDYELLLRVARNRSIQFHNLDRVLLKYRRHSGQVTNERYFRTRYADISGYLLTELLHSHSPKYIVGMLVIHPFARQLRSAVRRLLRRA